MPVSYTFRRTFDVAKFDEFGPSKTFDSSASQAIHKDVPLSFALSLSPNDTRDELSNFLGVYLKYINGPKEALTLGCDLFVVNDVGPLSLGKFIAQRLLRGAATCGHGFSRRLPRSIEALACGKYLKSNNTMLEIEAIVTIPDHAFDNPDGDRKVLTAAQDTQTDLFRLALFNQLTTAVPTNEPFCDRFELQGTDGSFWAHKSLLAFSSEVFKDWLFHPDKPPEAQSAPFNKGVLQLDLSKDQLRHILHFIYLDHTAHGFNKHALEIVEPAERFRFKELKRVCERSLLHQLDSMSTVSLFESLKTSDTFTLAQLKNAALDKLVQRFNQEGMLDVNDQEKFVLNMLNYAFEHEHEALRVGCDAKLAALLEFNINTSTFLAMVSAARMYDLDELANSCAKWMAKNYQMFKEEGHLTKLMNDQTEDGHAVIEFIMQRQSKYMLQHLP